MVIVENKWNDSCENIDLNMYIREKKKLYKHTYPHALQFMLPLLRHLPVEILEYATMVLSFI